ncbi:outer membrane protein assembly factor BamC [Pseudomonas sp. N040]|uniref:outer membrane protein assembly factor BamC n=1 Tax=Pseudomonas sp. N040 TaxID=2785325 RepID=UPI0018A2C772|nr:outer membrane protein assembly factor BamC [Pseudomonas sp. N040]MBF7729343.1 outer membrane protein assembly factor BamC [Pseudomonas sp. N040]MBW7012983.1 outer membrane protein assembly factor BamC [Pseudomonas sp. N040]
MKRIAGLSALALIISSTSACSWLGLTGKDGYFRDRSDDYLESRQTAPMQLPEGVQSKPLDALLPIPGNVANSNVAEYKVPRPPLLLPTSGIYSDFTLQKNDDVRWLVAKRSTADVWPMALQFFENSGFQIAQQSQQTGEFLTAWQPRKDLSAALGPGSEDLEDGNSDSDIRIRVRVEPGVQKGTTEVFVATALRDTDSGDEDLEWLTDTGVETSLLDGLMTSMAASDEESPQVSLLAERDFDAPSLARVADDASGNPVLTLGTDYDRAWSSVGRAIAVADIRVDDLDRTTGIYYVDLARGAQDQSREEPGFFDWITGGPADEAEQEDAGAGAERYLVRLVGIGNSTQVALLTPEGGMAPYDLATRVLGQIQTSILTPVPVQP